VASQLKRVTSDTQVTAVGSGTYVKSVVLASDGTNAASVIIRDGDKASGTAVLSLNTAGAGPAVVWSAGDKKGAYLADGLGVDVTGTGAACSVEFETAE
jgi:hypothetical protein